MRVGTMLAGVGLAAVTMMWGAPVALASEMPTAPGQAVALAADPAPGSDSGEQKADEEKADGGTRGGDRAKRGDGERGTRGSQPTDRHGDDPKTAGAKLPVDLPNVGGGGVVGGVGQVVGGVVGGVGQVVGGVVGGVLGGHDRDPHGRPGDRGGYDQRNCDRDNRRDLLERDGWFQHCDKDRRDRSCGCDSDHDRDWFRDCDRDHRSKSDRDRHRWFRDCDKHHRDKACGCDSDDDHDGKDDDDDDKDSKDKDKDSKDKDSKDKDTKASNYPKGAPETGGGPVDDGNPLALIVLGMTGLAGAGLAGAGAIAEWRAAQH